MRRLYESREGSNCSPCEQDASDPDPCPDPMQDKVAGDLKQEVSPEENSGSESKLLACDPQLPIHAQCCESEIDSVDECNHVESKQEREKSNLKFSDCSHALHSPLTRD